MENAKKFTIAVKFTEAGVSETERLCFYLTCLRSWLSFNDFSLWGLFMKKFHPSVEDIHLLNL